MSGRELIFSNKRSHRVARHLTFWAVYTFYFYPQGIWYPNSIDKLLQTTVYWEALINFACFVPVCMLATYVAIYGLLPSLLEKKRYGRFALFFTLLFLVCVVINYFSSLLYLSLIPHPEKETSFASILYLSYINSLAAIILSTIGIGLKAAKNWSKQQRENLEISRKKARTELQLHKAKIHPEFLFRTLNNIHARITDEQEDAPDMVLRLSDLLSYSLYGSKCKVVPLVQEVAALHDLVFLEKRKEDHYLNLSVTTSGDNGAVYLPPMTILSLLNDTIGYLNNTSDIGNGAVVHVNIHSASARLIDVSLTVHITEPTPLQGWSAIVQNCILRLEGLREIVSYQIQEKRYAREFGVAIQLQTMNSFPLLDGKTKKGIYESV